jgi:hypothetical protein
VTSAAQRDRERDSVLHALRLVYPKGMDAREIARLLFGATGHYRGRVSTAQLMVPLLSDQLVTVRTDSGGDRYYARPPR